MGIGSRVRSGLRKVMNKMSGDYSAAAPEVREPYKKPDQPPEEVEVVMARLKRPPPPKDS